MNEAVLDTSRIALVGNPNSGKTALFNALTGSRQKVANYPGVTVERKEGMIHTPADRRVMVVDLPGTYSLRARSPDEEVTRDVVLGRLAGETTPDVLVCVADATNLRLVLRLALELKAVGKPIILALNMYDIAERRGLSIDLPRLSAELGMPVVTTVAVRKRGLTELLEQVDELLPQVRVQTAQPEWRAPSSTEIRAAHREAERILKTCVLPPARPDTWTGRLDGVLLHPVSGVLILLTVLFLMFQAVFTWATPAKDLLDAGFTALSGLVTHLTPPGMIGQALQPVMAPVGFNWQITVALIPAFAAREVVVAVLGTVYALGNGGAGAGMLAGALAHQWSLPTALSVLAWFVFAPQCISTLSVVRRETNSWKWPLVMVAYMTTLAYLASFATYQLASLIWR